MAETGGAGGRCVHTPARAACGARARGERAGRNRAAAAGGAGPSAGRRARGAARGGARGRGALRVPVAWQSRVLPHAETLSGGVRRPPCRAAPAVSGRRGRGQRARAARLGCCDGARNESQIRNPRYQIPHPDQMQHPNQIPDQARQGTTSSDARAPRNQSTTGWMRGVLGTVSGRGACCADRAKRRAEEGRGRPHAVGAGRQGMRRSTRRRPAGAGGSRSNGPHET